MKRLFAIILAVSALLALASCSAGKDGNESETTKGGDTTTSASSESNAPNDNEPVFVHNNVTIKMNAPADPILTALGEPKSTYMAPSCAFQGNDYYYDYGSFEVSAYEENGERRIYSVVLKDDLVTTPEGLAIGSPEADAAKIYGESAHTDNGNYVLKTSNVTVTVIIKDGAVSSIDYVAAVEGN